jgi:uncharacterized protein (DUF2141 family)
MRTPASRALTLGAAAVVVTPFAWSQTPPAVAPMPTPPPIVNTIVAVVTALRSDAGVVRVGLYNSAARWPQSGMDWRACDARIHGRRATCEIPNVGAGTYAIAMTHDENNNNHFDQGFLGWPLEGYGFSNNVRPRMLGPPPWDGARFDYRGGPPLTINMGMQYY